MGCKGQYTLYYEKINQNKNFILLNQVSYYFQDSILLLAAVRARGGLKLIEALGVGVLARRWNYQNWQ